MKRILRGWRWVVIAAMLCGIGWLLCSLFPPKPRWTARGAIQLFAILPDGLVTKEVHDEKPSLVVREPETGAERLAFPIQENPLGNHFSFRRSADGRYLLLADWEGKLVADLRTGQTFTMPVRWRPDNDSEVAFAPEEDLAVVGNHNFTLGGFASHVRLFIVEISTGRVLDELEGVRERESRSAFAVTPSYVVFQLPGKKGIGVWDRRKKALGQSVPGRLLLASPAEDLVILYEPAVMLHDEVPLLMWDLGAEKAVAKIGTHSERGFFGAFSRDGQKLTFIDQDNILEFWDVPGRKRIGHGNVELGWKDLKFSEDGGRVLLSRVAGSVEMWDASTGRELWRTGDLSNPIPLGPIRSDWRWLMLLEGKFEAGVPHVVPHVLDASTGVEVTENGETFVRLKWWGGSTEGRFVWGASSKTEKRELSSVEKFLRKWLPADWLSDTRVVGEVLVLDLEKGAIHARLENLNSERAALSSDGRILVTSIGQDKQNLIQCWDLPLSRPWALIVGVPAGIGVSVLAWKWLRHKRRAA